MQNLLNDLVESLKEDERFVSEGKLLKNKVIELALSLDASLLKLLLKNESIKKHFFHKIDEVLVFDKVKFQKFISNKSFLPDSYTSFKNEIGFTANDEFLTDMKEVVLVWPYKDCVLEGGQDKEDAKRNEVFWNETLAPDEIDRLLAPKALTNFKRFSKDGETKATSISPTDNLIIKGNNLIALHTLVDVYPGKVKVIYIDPPYNTGNDEFKYNDTFNQSTWLTFIKNRLQIAYDLLSDDGSIFISIDNNELGYLLVILDSIFGQENLKNIITVKRGSVTGHKTINQGVVNLTEYVVVYAKNSIQWKPNKVFIERDRNVRYNNFILNRDKDISEWQFCSLLDAFAENQGIPKSKLKKKLGENFEEIIFNFIVERAESVIQFAYPDETKVSAEAQELIKQSKQNPDIVFYLKRENEPDIYLLNGQRILFYSDRLIKVEDKWVTGELLSDIWLDVLPNDLHNEGGVSLKKGKKPEKLISRILELATNKGDTVIDFHVGSGTTAAVAHKMGRHYIGIEQMDYIQDITLKRMKSVVDGEQGGISKSVGWLGGGNFIYCELNKANQKFVEKIQGSTNTEELLIIWSEMQDKAFLSYKVDTKAFDNAKTEFEQLGFEEQQKLLIEILDKNMLYVPLSEIDDDTFGVSEEDKMLNVKFFNQGN